MDDISQRLGSLLREAGIRQKDVAGWWSGHLGYEVPRSRVSRGLRGKVDLPGSEKVALFEALIEHGVLRDRADGLFVAEQLRLAREVLGAALPPIAIVTNLSPPGEQVYVRPLAHDTLLAKLVSERPLDERERARFVALVGAPGSGKSELVRRLAFEEPLTQWPPAVLLPRCPPSRQRRSGRAASGCRAR